MNVTPQQLNYGDVGTNSLVIPLQADSTNTDVGTLTFTLEPESGGANPTNCPKSAPNQFSPTASWQCGYGVLRLDLVPVSGSMSASSLSNQTMTVFAVPVQSATGSPTAMPLAYAGGTSNTNELVGMPCGPNTCTLQVSGLTQQDYYLRVSSLYEDMSMQLTAMDDSSPSKPVLFDNAQAVVDSTGKAVDVLRRVQVSFPLNANSQNQAPDYGLQTTDSLCKQFAVTNGYYSNSASSSVTGTTLPGGNDAEALCF